MKKNMNKSKKKLKNKINLKKIGDTFYKTL